MISSKSSLNYNPDGTFKNVFNPTNYAKDLTSDFPILSKDNIFTGSNTFNDITAISSITAPNITALTDEVNGLYIPNVEFNAVYNIPSTLHTMATASPIPDVVLANVASGSILLYLPFLTNTIPANYSGRTFIIHCLDGTTIGTNTITIDANNGNIYDKFGIIRASNRVMNIGDIQRYYTYNGIYYEL